MLEHVIAQPIDSSSGSLDEPMPCNDSTPLHDTLSDDLHDNDDASAEITCSCDGNTMCMDCIDEKYPKFVEMHRSRDDHSLELSDMHAMHDVENQTPLSFSSSPSLTCESDLMHSNSILDSALSTSHKSEDKDAKSQLISNPKVNLCLQEFNMPIIDDDKHVPIVSIDSAFDLASDIHLDSLELLGPSFVLCDDHTSLLDDVKHIHDSYSQILSCDLPPDILGFDGANDSIDLDCAIDDRVVLDYVTTITEIQIDSLIPSVACCMPLVDFIGCEKHLLSNAPDSSLLTLHTPLCHFICPNAFHGFKYFDSCGIFGVGTAVVLVNSLQANSLGGSPHSYYLWIWEPLLLLGPKLLRIKILSFLLIFLSSYKPP